MLPSAPLPQPLLRRLLSALSFVSTLAVRGSRPSYGGEGEPAFLRAAEALPKDGLFSLAQRIARGPPSSFGDVTADLGSRSFSSLFSGGQHAAPALAALFQEIDSRIRPIEHPQWKAGSCSSVAEKVLASGDFPHEEARVIHTGAFLSDDGGTKKWQGAARKLRLGVMSFLATQDLGHTKLHFWTDVDKTHPMLQDALAPIANHPDFKRSVSVTTFDAAHEIGKLSPDKGDVLLQLYNKDPTIASKSDLLRAVVMHNYGGAWVDTDVLMIHDFAPLMGEDWAYIGQPGFINNAVLSASKPGSPFMAAYLGHAVARGIDAANDKNYFKYGPSLLGDLFRKVESNSTFHVLPTCFFDGAWSGEVDTVGWDEFFGSRATERQVAYATPGSPNNNAFAYHWHGRWEKPIVEGSLADVAEQLYSKKLGLA